MLDTRAGERNDRKANVPTASRKKQAFDCRDLSRKSGIAAVVYSVALKRKDLVIDTSQSTGRPTGCDIDGDGIPDALWNEEKYADEWAIMYAVGLELGLNVGGLWRGFIDGPHFQFRKGNNPTRTYGPEKLKEILIENGLLPKED